jgi:hypothetical protein
MARYRIRYQYDLGFQDTFFASGLFETESLVHAQKQCEVWNGLRLKTGNKAIYEVYEINPNALID